MLLEVTFGKLYSWAIHNIRNILLEAGARFKELGTSSQNPAVENGSVLSVSYGAINYGGSKGPAGVLIII